MSEYSQGVCEDGAAILCDGKRVTVDEIVSRLNGIAELEADQRRLEWLVENEEFVTETASGYTVLLDVFSDSWRDAIDEAMEASDE